VTATTVTQVLSESNFCSMYLSTCGNGMGWADGAACSASVAQFLTGTAGVVGGNTLSCRLYHLNVARQQVDGSAAETLHCGHASPSGNNVCTGLPTASDFCDDFIGTCGTSAGWSTAGQCELAVPSFIAGSYPTQVSGNTFGCRAYHLGVAKAQSVPAAQAAHCAHASPTGTDANGVQPCAGSQAPVASFCSDFISTCGTGNGWADSAACVSEATGYVRGVVGDTASFNTLECRIYHLTVAKQQANASLRTAHCSHASRAGVTPICEPLPSAADFCSTFLDVCSVTGAWSTQQGCINGFSIVPRGFQGDLSGDTQGCRLYHLGAAMMGVSPGTTAHCTHASETGNNVCVAPAGQPVAPPVALTTTPAPTSPSPTVATSPSPTVAGATLTPTAPPTAPPASIDTSAQSGSSAGASQERTEHSRSTSTVAYVITFLVGLLAYEYILYINAVNVVSAVPPLPGAATPPHARLSFAIISLRFGLLHT
jgi:hypothetical protein